MPWQPVAAKELGGRRVVVAHLPQRRLTLEGYSGDHQVGDGKMGERRGEEVGPHRASWATRSWATPCGG